MTLSCLSFDFRLLALFSAKLPDFFLPYFGLTCTLGMNDRALPFGFS